MDWVRRRHHRWGRTVNESIFVAKLSPSLAVSHVACSWLSNLFLLLLIKPMVALEWQLTHSPDPLYVLNWLAVSMKSQWMADGTNGLCHSQSIIERKRKRERERDSSHFCGKGFCTGFVYWILDFLILPCHTDTINDFYVSCCLMEQMDWKCSIHTLSLARNKT